MNCPHCQNSYSAQVAVCPFCGAANERLASSQPKSKPSISYTSQAQELERAKEILRVEANRQRLEAEQKLKPVEYYAISTPVLLVVLILSAGLFSYYWFYRNWQAICAAQRPGISPMMRASFSFITCFGLFTKMTDDLIRRGCSKKMSPISLGIFYVVFFSLDNMNLLMSGQSLIPYSYKYLIFVSQFVPLILLQTIVNDYPAVPKTQNPLSDLMSKP